MGTEALKLMVLGLSCVGIMLCIIYLGFDLFEQIEDRNQRKEVYRFFEEMENIENEE